VCAILVCGTLFVYGPVVRYPFVNFDDPSYVAENPIVQRGLTADGFSWAFFTRHASNWHPLTWLSHMLDCQLWGMNAGGHHLTNLLLHVANTLLLFVVLRRMTGAFWQCAVVSALFAWHPLHVESVAWVAERKDVLSGFFGLLTLLSYACWVEKPSRPRYWLALILFALGLMSKPMLVTLPCVLLLLDYWPLKRNPELPFCGRSSRENSGEPTPEKKSVVPWSRLVMEKAPFFILAALSCFITFVVQSKGGSVSAVQTVPVSWRVSNALIACAGYLRKTFCPSDLAVFYPYSVRSIHQLLIAVLILALVFVVVLRRRRRSPWLFVGWLWFLGTLIPVIGLVQVGNQAMADRYTYLPSIGIFIMLAWGVPEFLAAIRLDRVKWGIAIAALVLPAILVSARIQTSRWKDSETLFRHTLTVTTDNAMAHAILGRLLDVNGKSDEAREQLVAAVKINPRAPEALESLGTYYARHQDYSNAVVYWRQAMQYGPAPRAHLNLGKLMVTQGYPAQAVDELAAAASLEPENAEIRKELGTVLAQLGRFDEAVIHLDAAIAIDPGDAVAHDQLGNVLFKQGQIIPAAAEYATAVRLRPDFSHALFRLGLIQLQRQDFSGARASFLHLTQVDPSNADGFFNLGCVYASENNFPKAAEAFSESIRLKPDDAEARVRLAAVLAAQGKTEEAVRSYRELLQLSPDYVPALRDLAWILATSPREEIRNGTEAVRLAERARDLSHGETDTGTLTVLDVAYAETGRFDDAIKTATVVQDLATRSGRTQVAEQAEKRIALYKSGKPFRQ
jgi:Flp pilus assembly protein TadD